MDELKYDPVSHDHKAFLKKAQRREGFSKAYNDLEEEYTLVREMLSARSNRVLKNKNQAVRQGNFGDVLKYLNNLNDSPVCDI